MRDCLTEKNSNRKMRIESLNRLQFQTLYQLLVGHTCRKIRNIKVVQGFKTNWLTSENFESEVYVLC